MLVQAPSVTSLCILGNEYLLQNKGEDVKRLASDTHINKSPHYKKVKPVKLDKIE